MSLERTLAIVKPDGVEQRVTGKILAAEGRHSDWNLLDVFLSFLRRDDDLADGNRKLTLPVEDLGVGRSFVLRTRRWSIRYHCKTQERQTQETPQRHL